MVLNVSCATNGVLIFISFIFFASKGKCFLFGTFELYINRAHMKNVQTCYVSTDSPFEIYYITKQIMYGGT